jgi:hypothetical protein
MARRIEGGLLGLNVSSIFGGHTIDATKFFIVFFL